MITLVNEAFWYLDPFCNGTSLMGSIQQLTGCALGKEPTGTRRCTRRRNDCPFPLSGLCTPNPSAAGATKVSFKRVLPLALLVALGTAAPAEAYTRADRASIRKLGISMNSAMIHRDWRRECRYLTPYERQQIINNTYQFYGKRIKVCSTALWWQWTHVLGEGEHKRLTREAKATMRWLRKKVHIEFDRNFLLPNIDAEITPLPQDGSYMDFSKIRGRWYSGEQPDSRYSG